MTDFNPLAGIDWGTQLSSNVVKYHFYPDGITLPLGISVSWNAYEQQQARLAFQLFSNISNLTFVEVATPEEADWTLGLVAMANRNLLGQMGAPGTGAGAGLAQFNVAAEQWSREPGGYLEIGADGFQTLIHEMGHGLGLGHPHDQSGGVKPIFPGVTGSGDVGTFALNQDVFTMMSYIDGWHTSPNGPAPSLLFGGGGTPMAFDIAVLQQKYGVNTEFNHGDDVYDLPDADATGTFYQAIWDTGGIDTLRYGGERNVVIDLNAASLAFEPNGGGFVSYAVGVHGGYTIAHGVAIENAMSGSGDDRLIGNGWNNVFTPGAGDDRVIDNGMYDLDIVVINADRAETSVEFTNYTRNSVVLEGPDGKDTLSGVERIAFRDGTLATDIYGKAGDAFRLYLTALDRLPDQTGLSFWVGALDDAVALVDVAAAFTTSDEYQSLYGTVTDSQFITGLYDNLYDRAPDEAGQVFWEEAMASGASRADILVSFATAREAIYTYYDLVKDGIWLDPFLA